MEEDLLEIQLQHFKSQQQSSNLGTFARGANVKVIILKIAQQILILIMIHTKEKGFQNHKSVIKT